MVKRMMTDNYLDMKKTLKFLIKNIYDHMEIIQYQHLFIYSFINLFIWYITSVQFLHVQ